MDVTIWLLLILSEEIVKSEVNVLREKFEGGKLVLFVS